VSFFDPPEEPDRAAWAEERPRRPDWWDEPDTVLGGVVTTQFVLARTDTLAIAVRQIVAYPAGFRMGLVIIARDGHLLPEGGPDFGPGSRRGGGSAETAFRFGLRYADGTKLEASWQAPYLGRDVSRPPDLDHLSGLDEAPRPFIAPSGGSGGTGLQWYGGYWATPLPPPGPLGFVAQWLDGGVPETTVTIEADAILDAARTSRSIWDS